MKFLSTLSMIVISGICTTAQIDSKELSRDQRAANEVPVISQDVFVTFEHFGDMTGSGGPPTDGRSQPRNSELIKDRSTATAGWFRLHNDSHLPIKISTLSSIALDTKCSSKRQNEPEVKGLCDDREVNISYGLENKKGALVSVGFDSSFSATVLPGTSILFPVPLNVLNGENAVRFIYTFLKDSGGKLDEYGKSVTIKIRKNDIPKPLLQGSKSVLLPVSQAKTVSDQCSRPAPNDFSDTWEPNQAQIEEMEWKLNDISKLEVKSCCIIGGRVEEPGDWYRQYVGLIWHGRKVIYINGVSRDKPNYKVIRDGMVIGDWTTDAVMVCDGGTAWGVIYDVRTKTFSELAVNGVA
jgi:hypothetical protein